jgi:hypothetical protein
MKFIQNFCWETGRGRSRRSWENNIRMGLRETVRENVDWMHLSQAKDRWRAVVNTVTNLRSP